MRKFAPICVSLAVVAGFLAMSAAPASARRRHHHHHRHHNGGGGGTPPTVTCGAGTVLIDNTCVATGGGSPGGSSSPGVIGGTTISPSTLRLTPTVPPVAGQGKFTSNFTMSGLPPLTTFTLSAGDANCPIATSSTGPFTTTASVRTVTFNLNNALGTCMQGLHPVTLTSTSAGSTPFTAYVNFTA